MKYISQMNAFYDLLMTNPIPANAQAIYMALLHINNKCAWREEFTVANVTIQSICSISRSELDRQRNTLIQKGFIEYKKGTGNQAGKYKIVSLYGTQYGTQVNTQVETQTETQPGTQTQHSTGTLNRLEKTIDNDDDLEGPRTDLDDQSKILFKKLIKLYQENIGVINPIVGEELMDLVKAYDYELIVEAFKIASMNQARSLKYIMKILESWNDKNIKTLEDIKAFEKASAAKKEKQNGQKATDPKRSGKFKTKFHLSDSRTSKYSPDELEDLILKRQKAAGNS